MEDQRLCNDILVEILLRLPEKSVTRFKCVSKSWDHIISDAIFREKYTERLLPLLGFFQCSSNSYWPNQFLELCFLPTSVDSMIIRSHNFNKLGFYLASSNGLILCSGSTNGLILCSSPPATYYVCNPVTDEWFQLPQPKSKFCNAGDVIPGFHYEESLEKDGSRRSRYRIVMLYPVLYSHAMVIETYVSEAGVWQEFVLRSAETFCSPMIHWCSVVVRGIFFWYMHSEGDMFVAYDPEAAHDFVWLMKLSKVDMYARWILGESADGFLQYCVNESHGLSIFKLGKKLHDYSPYQAIPETEWIRMMKVVYKVPTWWDDHMMGYYAYPISFHPQNSRFILMWTFHGIIFWYDLESGKSTAIWCLPLPCLKESFKTLIPYFRPARPPSPIFQSI